MISYVKGLSWPLRKIVIVVEAGHVGLAIHVPVSLPRSFREWGRR